MRLCIILLLTVNSLFAQKYVTAYAQIDSVHRDKVLSGNLGTDQVTRTFLKKYPILNNFENYNRLKKYSLINANLVTGGLKKINSRLYFYTLKSVRETRHGEREIEYYYYVRIKRRKNIPFDDATQTSTANR